MWIRRLLILALLATTALSAAAFERTFPASAKRGKMTPANFPAIVIDGKQRALSPAARIFNQDNLIEMRTAHGVQTLRPGLTGWAQVNGRDELPLPEKVRLDLYYVQRQSLGLDMKVILLTVLKVLRRDGIVH